MRITTTTPIREDMKQNLVGYYLVVENGTWEDFRDVWGDATEEIGKDLKDELSPDESIEVTRLVAEYEIRKFHSLPEGSSEDSLPENAIPCYSLLTL